MNTNSSLIEPVFAPWRHGGWYVMNARYPTGACGCVSKNYPDGKWRIVTDERRKELGAPGDITFATRDAAAKAEILIAQAEHEKLAPYLDGIEDPQLKYSLVSLFEGIEKHPEITFDKHVEGVLRLRDVDAEQLRVVGARFAADQTLKGQTDSVVPANMQKLKVVGSEKCPGLVINAGFFFEDPEFVAWLNNGQPKMTWHTGGEPGDWSDVAVLVDPSLNGEGSDSDMPERFWDMIVEECHAHFKPGANAHIMVRLVNDSEGQPQAERPRG